MHQEMDIRLGGFNIDYDVLTAVIRDEIEPEDAIFTPETIAAAYARVSRSNKPLHVLRQEAVANVAEARKSVGTISHKMGHKSIADHAYFNFDLNLVSRLAVELIEKHRLAGYTERSQRFVKFKDDFMIPEEIIQIGLADEFVKLYRFMFRIYNELYQVLREHVFESHSVSDESKLSLGEITNLENLAKEDSRYAIGLAVQTSFGASFNAQELELVIRHLLSHTLLEAQEIGRKFKDLVQPLAPSLIKYCEPVEYFQNLPNIICEIGAEFRSRVYGKIQAERINSFWFNEDPDDVVIAAILCEGNVGSLNQCLALAQTMTYGEKSNILFRVLKDRQIHDNVSRHFEFADFTFDTVGSASLYAQLKRHRISTQIPGDYQLEFGVTIPESIIECKLVEKLKQVVEASEKLYQKILEATDSPVLATYALTNAHCRRIQVKMNLREIYHFAKERCSAFAQWDIRETANQMIELVRAQAPITGQLLCGKDVYEKNILFCINKFK